MGKLIDASFKAIGSIFAPGMLGVFVASVLLSIAALVGFVVFVTTFATLIGSGVSQDYQHYIPWLTGVGAGILAYMLFPGIMPLVVSFFDSRIATKIEAQSYPMVPAAEPEFWPELWHDVRFGLIAIALNIIVLPLYLIPVINLFVFYILNGHLLGREFFITVARRYRPLNEARAMQKKHSRIIFVAGILLTLLATIPIVNLLAPFWGIAVMIHLYHALAGTPKTEILLPN